MIQENDSRSDRIEPEKMSDRDIQSWLLTCRDALIVLKSEETVVFNRIYDDFVSDLKILKDYGRLDEDEMIKIIEEVEDQL